MKLKRWKRQNVAVSVELCPIFFGSYWKCLLKITDKLQSCRQYNMWCISQCHQTYSHLIQQMVCNHFIFFCSRLDSILCKFVRTFRPLPHHLWSHLYYIHISFMHSIPLVVFLTLVYLCIHWQTYKIRTKWLLH